MNLTGQRQQRWIETVCAISAIADADKDVCIKIVTDQLDELEGALYKLTLDPPEYIVHFFRLIRQLSSELFSNFVRRLDMDDPRAIKTIVQLVKSQPKERANYEKLARLACRMGGDLRSLGESLLMRLEEASAAARSTRVQT